MSNAGLQFGVLGPLQASADGVPVPLGAPKQRAVLAMLLMNRNRAVSVDALIDAVWDQSPVPAARTSIHSYVSNLRRLLGSPSRDPNRVLASVPPGYQINVADADSDLGRFVTEKDAGAHAAAGGGSKMPAPTCRRPWPNGAGRSSTTFGNSPSSIQSPLRWPRSEWRSKPLTPKPRSPAGVPTRLSRAWKCSAPNIRTASDCGLNSSPPTTSRNASPTP